MPRWGRPRLGCQLEITNKHRQINTHEQRGKKIQKTHARVRGHTRAQVSACIQIRMNTRTPARAHMPVHTRAPTQTGRTRIDPPALFGRQSLSGRWRRKTWGTGGRTPRPRGGGPARRGSFRTPEPATETHVEPFGPHLKAARPLTADFGIFGFSFEISRFCPISKSPLKVPNACFWGANNLMARVTVQNS